MSSTASSPCRRAGRRARTRLLGVSAGSVSVVVLLGTVGLMWTGTTGTLSGWSSGVFTNSTDTTAAGRVTISHSAGSGCSLGPRVTTTVACTGSVVGSETVTNGGDLDGDDLAGRVRADSCAAVKFDNAATPADVLLARNTPDFQVADPWGSASNTAVALASSSYAAAVVQQTEAPPAVSGAHGIGIWFKAAAGQAGPLMSFGTSPTAAAGTDTQSIVVNAAGTVSFYWRSTTPVYTTTGNYANGVWHFAYLRFVRTSTPSVTFTVSIDSVSTTGTAVTGAYPTTNTGYWRVGYAPTSLTGQSTTFFTGAVSNAAVFWGTTSAPATPTATNLASQASFTSWASSATERWLLGDTGTTTYTGSQPVIATTSPCSYVDVVWSFANPTATAVSSMRLSAFATGTAYPVSAMPDPGTAQTSSLAISRDSTYNAYVTGLRLYVPITYVAQTRGGFWPLTFTWNTNASVVIPS